MPTPQLSNARPVDPADLLRWLLRHNTFVGRTGVPLSWSAPEHHRVRRPSSAYAAARIGASP
jgi:hypothetical protein